MAALLPTDFLYFTLGVNNPFVRLPRLMKYGDFTEFFIRLDARIRHYQYILRLMKTIIYMVYLIHLNACAYFAISYYEGIGSNSFVYDGVGNAYFRCFYFATKTATSIGKNNKPQNTAEIVFMICSWMVGVFFFSILVGNIRDILGTAMKNKNEFRARQSAINSYMVKYKVDIKRDYTPLKGTLKILFRFPNWFKTVSSCGWSSLGSNRKTWMKTKCCLSCREK